MRTPGAAGELDATQPPGRTVETRMSYYKGRATGTSVRREGFCIQISLHRWGWIVAWTDKGTPWKDFESSECRSSKLERAWQRNMPRLAASVERPDGRARKRAGRASHHSMTREIPVVSTDAIYPGLSGPGIKTPRDRRACWKGRPHKRASK